MSEAVSRRREEMYWSRVAKLNAFALAVASLLLALPPGAQADNYPSRPIKLLVGASAGATTDTMARAIAQPLSVSLGQPVLVETGPARAAISRPIPSRSRH